MSPSCLRFLIHAVGEPRWSRLPAPTTAVSNPAAIAEEGLVAVDALALLFQGLLHGSDGGASDVPEKIGWVRTCPGSSKAGAPIPGSPWTSKNRCEAGFIMVVMSSNSLSSEMVGRSSLPGRSPTPWIQDIVLLRLCWGRLSRLVSLCWCWRVSMDPPVRRWAILPPFA
eukprot:16447013-Heterocapsa_arctica.AAC.1